MSPVIASDSRYRVEPDASDLAHIPGRPGWPLIGRTPEVIRDLHAVAAGNVRDHGPVSRLCLLGQQGLMVTGADHYQRIFQDPQQEFSAFKGYERQFGTFYPRGLLLMDFDEHRANRRLMQGAFKLAALQRYLEMMQPTIDRHINSWGDRRDFVFYPAVKELLLEVGAQCFLGIEDFNREAPVINQLFLELNAGMLALVRAELPFGAFGRAMRARRALERWCDGMIQQRRRDGGGDDVLSHLCRQTDEQGEPYGVKSIVDHVIFLLFAAHDTTTSALTHLMMYLGRDEAVQRRLRDHLTETVPGTLTHADLEKLDFAEHCFHEVLRLHPPVPMAVRRTIRPMNLGGYDIPAHTVLYLPMMINQRDPQWWTDPDRFDPDRFAAPRNEHRRHPMAFHPFGSGAHKCIGMHFADMLSSAFLHRFLSRYAVAAPEGYAPRLEWVPLPKPADGVPLTLRAL